MLQLWCTQSFLANTFYGDGQTMYIIVSRRPSTDSSGKVKITCREIGLRAPVLGTIQERICLAKKLLVAV